ncbi:FAD/FMN-containing dehydrogenase/Fe-S oxidoreductase [Lewinella marina]|uniref:FAD-binding oxidoreductase n=1 Tax=Neolewinella marina TaxID=438751 RepID=A0A2G0CH99_9BACT|nr:FAD-binding and (Fe-S)-binding domain-containing protein [Neolewinella marina]NJB86171.1 FAD/FMN-containing dehydrogenase/Fe-S oxidoreductase [Neolewinella marina]PHK99352.1 FAD-binding oxidoreductase [Neolewinella marina]
MPIPPWSELAARLSGELETDTLYRILYATDASVYREVPRAVAFPRTEADVVACVAFCRDHRIPITPRAGGTSLAGQAVGNGLVVDVSRHLRGILEINPAEGYAIVEPGVIRDQLNAALQPHGYWFGPNTSTANRCTLGGMFGNNSCGSTSITVGSTRDHVLEARVVLADGSLVTVGAGAQVPDSPRLAAVHRFLDRHLTDPEQRSRILAAYPKAGVTRRNNGYALDILAGQSPYDPAGPPLNLCTLLASSEGTLALTTALKVNILPLPPAGSAVVALHFRSIDASLRATQLAMESAPFMCELMDDTILQLALQNHDQRKNAAFVEGNPRALLLVEYRAATDAEALRLARALGDRLTETGRLPEPPYAAPALAGSESTNKVWNLRAAGLGILGNMVGDAKAVACIEDTAVALPDLADYIAEFEELMRLYQQNPVFYAHAGAGELHLRPILDLKKTADRERFYEITRDVARLVKKYRGSLSGEHGDGRVRGQFLSEMLGPEVYALLVELKRTWDPEGILNPGKIVEAPPMNESLRYEADPPDPVYHTALDFSHEQGILRAAEKCNGSGDCRKLTGGAMCPSYRATLNEKDSTRGRANVLREVLTRNQREDPFTHPALAEAMDLCLSCKACTSECPSTVNMTNLKAEYLYQKQQTEGISLRTRLIAANETLYRLGGKMPRLANAVLDLTAPLMKRVVGIAAERSLPRFPEESLRTFYDRERPAAAGKRGRLYFFGDEFINYQDVAVGQAALRLWWKLDYEVIWPRHAGSGRAQLSKGLLREARRRAADNVTCFRDRVGEEAPLVGLEPSAILGFRDEYPKLLRGELQTQATVLGTHSFTFDEWLYREFSLGRLSAADFGLQRRELFVHVHCHEKALGEAGKCAAVLSLPPNFSVTLLDSGCCGMAGSFGYEAEHFAVSRTIAEQSLLSKLRDRPAGAQIVASGTSCRHTVKDELGERAWHSAEVLLSSW